MSNPKAADCDHHFEARIRGGEPLSVRICTLCRQPDWSDLREQLDVLYGGNKAALTRALGGDRTASVIAHTLNVHGHAIQRVRYMTDAQLLAVPGIGEASLATIRAAFPALEPRLLDCGLCYEEQGEEVHPQPDCPTGLRATESPVVGFARVGLIVQPGLADVIGAAEFGENAIFTPATDAVLMPVVEFTGAAVLSLKGDPGSARQVLSGGEEGRFAIDGIRYATSTEHPVIVEPFGWGIKGGFVTFTLIANGININGKEVGDA